MRSEGGVGVDLCDSRYVLQLCCNVDGCHNMDKASFWVGGKSGREKKLNLQHTQNTTSELQRAIMA
jgi:hypothetical protein